tara:strand:- start:7820 stop:8740 length:921 start_codon:yes stop_codon:yes gene_type:complete
MASTYSTTLRLELIGNGEQAGTWGTTTNTNLGSLIEQAITGVQTITMGDATYTLTSFDGAVDEARNAVLVLGGTVTTPQNLIAPSVEKTYIVKNGTGSNVTVKTSGGNGVTFLNNQVGIVYCDGTNFYPAVDVNNITGNVSVAGSITATANITATNRVTANVVSATSYLGLTGRIIQSVVGTSGAAYTTGTSYTSTGMSATITPTSTSSKILILHHAMLWQTNFYSGGANGYTSLYRNGSNLVPGSEWWIVNGPNNFYGASAYTHLDSPASTSALTYAIYFRASSGGDIAFNSDGSAGSIILLEIL